MTISHLKQMRLGHETDILGILFYLANTSSSFKRALFKKILDKLDLSSYIPDTFDVELNQEFSLGKDYGRADCYIEYIKEVKKKGIEKKHVIFIIIEGKLWGEVGTDQTDKYTKYLKDNYDKENEKETEAPHGVHAGLIHLIPSTEKEKEEKNGVKISRLFWREIGDEIEEIVKNDITLNSIQLTMFALIIDFIKNDIYEIPTSVGEYHKSGVSYNPDNDSFVGGFNSYDNVDNANISRVNNLITTSFEDYRTKGTRLATGKGYSAADFSKKGNDSTKGNLCIGFIDYSLLNWSAEPKFEKGYSYLTILFRKKQWVSQEPSENKYWIAKKADKLASVFPEKWGWEQDAPGFIIYPNPLNANSEDEQILTKELVALIQIFFK
jgi:hypothetical protein